MVNSGIVFSGPPKSDGSSATFPLPCVSATGRWLCAFRAAPSKQRNAGQRVLLTWSDDQGRSWQDPIEPFKPTTVDGKLGRMRFAGLTGLDSGRLLAAINWVEHTDPELPYFNEATEGLLDTRIFLSTSDDDGASWSPLRRMDTAPFPPPTPLTGPILSLPTGELAIQFELNKPYTDPNPWQHASVLMFSMDGGQTWPRHCIIAQDPANRIFYWDQRPSVLPDGHLFNIFWTFDREAAAYRNIHACESWDGGRIWSEPRDTGIPGQPGPVFPLGDGTLAMPCVDRTGPPAIKVHRSRNGGRTWLPEDALLLYASSGTSQTVEKASMRDAWSEMYAFSVGLPNAAALPGGGALLVYYAGPETNVTSIHWAVVR